MEKRVLLVIGTLPLRSHDLEYWRPGVAVIWHCNNTLRE